MRQPGLATLLIVIAVTGCGSGGGGPDAAYPDECGPVKTDAGNPNTLSERIPADVTLKKSCSPYHVDKPVLVTATLTIEPGVRIVACQGGCRSRITVAANGKLVAIGTPEEPIVFTSVYADGGGPLGGQWTGLLFLEAAAGSQLQNVVIEYAGGPYLGQPSDDEFNRYEFPVEGSLLNDSTPDLTVADVWVRHSRGYAVATTTSGEFEDSSASVYAAFERVTLTDNQNSIWVPVDQGGTLGQDICWFERDAMGACPAGAGPANHYVELHVDDELGRVPEDVRRDASWKPYAVPYKVQNINIRDNALLRVLDGVEIRMTEYGGITVGLNAPGALEIVGAAPGGVKVTSFYPTPTLQQYWEGLYIWENADSARTRIENVELSYGGRQSPTSTQAAGLISIYNSNPTIIGNHVSHSRAAGIHWNCIAEPAGLEEPPLPSTNTSDDPTIACAAAIGSGIAENYGCTCPMTGCQDRCPQP